ncbi:MAG: aminotransferase class III-fold pyridoxal phosphate-dependent enzyme, partial [Actinomycetales bacterium]
ELAVALVPPEQPVVTGVRGRGLLLAAVLRDVPAAQVEQQARANGLIVNAVAEDAIRVAPPLILSDQDVREFAQRWGNALTSLRPASTIGSR